MGEFNFDVAFRGQGLPEDGNIFYDALVNNGWTNKDGMALILKDQSSVKVVKGNFKVEIAGGTPSDAFLKILCAVNSSSTSNLAFYFRYRCCDVTTNKNTDSPSWDETLSGQTVAGTGTAKELIEKSIDLTHSNIADGDLFQYEFGIDGPNHAIAADIVVFSGLVKIQT